MSSGTELVKKFKIMMNQKEGTSKFVALFLLLEILSKYQVMAAECWQCLDPVFLDKLVLSEPSKSTTLQEACDLQSMGCSILQAYSSIAAIRDSNTYMRRSDALIKLYLRTTSTEVQKLQIEHILFNIADERKGAINLISNQSILDFFRIIIQTDRRVGISLVATALVHVISIAGSVADIFHDTIVQTIDMVAMKVNESKSSFGLYVELLRSITSAIPTERFNDYMKPKTVTAIRETLVHELSLPAKSSDYSDLLIMLGSMIRAVGHQFLLQDEKSPHDQRFFVLVSALASAEIRSSLAWLEENTHDHKYTLAALKVASCFDIIRIVCLHLITTEHLQLVPEDILKIRDNFSAAFAETIAYLRDRWDHSPLCPTSAWHVGTNVLSLPTDFDILHDPTIISGSQSLSLWLQEDESAHPDACGIMDVLLGLIKESSDTDISYASWLVPSIASLLDSDKGIDQFGHYNGTNIILARLDHFQRIAAKKDINSSVLSDELHVASIALDILHTADPKKAKRWEDTHQALTSQIQSAST